MFTSRASQPRSILHIDADAFFASVVQANDPKLMGKPLVVGRERGIAVAISYEARAFGVHRGMLMHEVKRACPSCVCVDSDFELFGHYSSRMFEIAHRYSPTVEEYSIDEGFLDLAGMRRPLRMSYEQIARHLQAAVKSELNIGVSVGVSLTKSLAKIASSRNKPAGISLISPQNIEPILQETDIHDVWGIGRQTAAYLRQLGISNAHELVSQPEQFLLRNRLSKPTIQIWHELQGRQMFDITPNSKQACKSISRTQTFTPASNNKDFLFCRLLYHIEDAFTRARAFGYSASKLYIFIKTSKFQYRSTEINLPQQTSYPLLIRQQMHAAFERIYSSKHLYRSAGATITNFQKNTHTQNSLFTDAHKIEKLKKIYSLFEGRNLDFGTLLWDQARAKSRGGGKRPLIKARFF